MKKSIRVIRENGRSRLPMELGPNENPYEVAYFLAFYAKKRDEICKYEINDGENPPRQYDFTELKALRHLDFKITSR